MTASLNQSSGQLTAPLAPCIEWAPGLYAVKADASVQLNKAGTVTTGTVAVTEDLSAPFDCGAGFTVTTGPLTLTPLAQSHDQDLDGCADWEELATYQVTGGLRDPFNFWDFFDVPTGAWPNLARNQSVTIADITAVNARFGSSGTPGDPLSPPPAPPAYHSAFDRGLQPLGPNGWNLDAANGSITISDVNSVVAQFGHNCTAAP